MAEEFVAGIGEAITKGAQLAPDVLLRMSLAPPEERSAAEATLEDGITLATNQAVWIRTAKYGDYIHSIYGSGGVVAREYRDIGVHLVSPVDPAGSWNDHRQMTSVYVGFRVESKMASTNISTGVDVFAEKDGVIIDSLPVGRQVGAIWCHREYPFSYELTTKNSVFAAATDIVFQINADWFTQCRNRE